MNQIMENKNIVNLWINLFRAIEVAKVGNYSISVYFDKDYEQGFDDYKLIKNYCSGFFDNFVENGDIKIEIRKPVSYNYKGKYNETIDNINERVNKSLTVKKPTILTESSKSLLNNAVDKLGFSFNDVERIKLIASTISQMDFVNIIEAQHIAEALQYNILGENESYNAEAKSIKFGDKIEIKLGVIDEDSIKSAINYLNNLLK